MKKILILLVILAAIGAVTFFLTMNAEQKNTNTKMTNAAPEVTPISHASMILNWSGMTIYTDPVRESQSGVFRLSSVAGPDPDVILLTDIHGDHLDVGMLKDISKEKTIIIAPMAVADMLPDTVPGKLLVMNNAQKTEELGFTVEAIPMYNLPEMADSRHPKGRGNGYVIEKDGIRVYISGDTAGIPEMRNLEDIDMAFVAMNLPYTMGVDEAADAVLAFQPKKVYPYHYRTEDGFSDIAKFKEIVTSGNKDIEVVELKWY